MDRFALNDTHQFQRQQQSNQRSNLFVVQQCKNDREEIVENRKCVCNSSSTRHRSARAQTLYATVIHKSCSDVGKSSSKATLPSWVTHTWPLTVGHSLLATHQNAGQSVPPHGAGTRPQLQPLTTHLSRLAKKRYQSATQIRQLFTDSQNRCIRARK